MNQQVGPRFYGEQDANLAELAGKTIAIIGYGNQGRPWALNMQDSGIDSIIVGNIRDACWEKAVADGFPTYAIGEACSRADVVCMLIPDEAMSQVYEQDVGPNLRERSILLFASGYPLAYELVKPAKHLDVVMLAPRMVGTYTRELYLQGKGFPSFISVEQDASARAWPLALALAKAVGSLRTGAMVLTARDEAYIDLFMEQTVGAIFGAAMLCAFQVGTEAGFPPEAMALELYMSGEMARTFQAMADVGFYRQVRLHGFAAAYGGLIRNLAMDHQAMQESMRQILEDIRNGAFARQLQAEVDQGYPSQAIIEEMLRDDNPLTQTEERIRGQMNL